MLFQKRMQEPNEKAKRNLASFFDFRCTHLSKIQRRSQALRRGGGGIPTHTPNLYKGSLRKLDIQPAVPTLLFYVIRTKDRNRFGVGGARDPSPASGNNRRSKTTGRQRICEHRATPPPLGKSYCVKLPCKDTFGFSEARCGGIQEYYLDLFHTK